MTSQVTKCPKCHTSFRVSDSQLSIASGAVRCGSCLHIFNAPDNWLIKDTADLNQPETAANSNENNTLTNDSGEQDTLDNIFDGDIFDDNTDLDEMASDYLSSSDDELDDLLDASDTYAIDDDDALFDDDELIGSSGSNSIINTEHDLLNHQPGTSSNNDNQEASFSSFFLELDEKSNTPGSIYKELDDLGEDDEPTEDSWANKLLEEDEEDQVAAPQQALEAEQHNPQQEDEFSDIFDSLDADQPAELDLAPDMLDTLNRHEQFTDQAEIEEEEFILSNGPLIADERIGDHKKNLLANIEPEPVEMTAVAGRNRWIRRGWISSIVATLLLLVVQYVVFNFDRLSRDESYRPLLISSCSLLGCKVPSLDDITLIRSSNLMVRSHPTAQNALVVDAIIINRADFKQPFPVMQLQFTDLAGKIVAGRNFNPNEYLAGELIGSKNMPIKQPVHISLEIADPGEHAINYQLHFYPLRNP